MVTKIFILTMFLCTCKEKSNSLHLFLCPLREKCPNTEFFSGPRVYDQKRKLFHTNSFVLAHSSAKNFYIEQLTVKSSI